MHNGKQVTKKPQKKVGGHEKGRTEEGKGGEPGVSPQSVGPVATRSAKGGYRQIRSGWALGALKLEVFLALESFIRTCLSAHAFYVSNLSTESSGKVPA